MKLIAVKLPTSTIRKLDQLILEEKYLSRSEIFRVALRDVLRRERKRTESSVKVEFLDKHDVNTETQYSSIA